METNYRICFDCTSETPEPEGTTTIDGCFVCDECSLSEMVAQ